MAVIRLLSIVYDNAKNRYRRYTYAKVHNYIQSLIVVAVIWILICIFAHKIYNYMSLLFAEPKDKVATQRNLSVTANNLTSLFQLPTVFLLPTCPAYERQRLIDKDVYFVVSDKYVHLPMLLANYCSCRRHRLL